MARNRPGNGPYSRLLARGSLDGRSREGRYLAALRAELTAHLGGDPSAAERLLIDRLAAVALRLQLFDEKFTAGTITDHDARAYGALLSAFRLLLRSIGMRAAGGRPLSIAERIRAAKTSSS